MDQRNSSREESVQPLPHTEEQLRAATIGQLKPLSGQIQLVEYDHAWPEQFFREEESVRSALGAKVLRLEHVGSTSVPGLPAKPIIDMVLVVADSADENTYLPAMETAGYVLRIREPAWSEHRMFKGPRSDINLHVFSLGCAETERMLIFRNWLRVNAPDRELYARTKRELAQKEWKYVQDYADAKTAVVERIIERAQAWAVRRLGGPGARRRVEKKRN